MTDTYKMTVDLNVLDHLGINLYSNIAAVLTEAIANASRTPRKPTSNTLRPVKSWIGSKSW